MYSHGVCLGYASIPDSCERLIELGAMLSSHHFVDKGDVLSTRKDEGELLVRGLKYVVDGIQCAINYLDILHALGPRPAVF